MAASGQIMTHCLQPMQGWLATVSAKRSPDAFKFSDILSVPARQKATQSSQPLHRSLSILTRKAMFSAFIQPESGRARVFKQTTNPYGINAGACRGKIPARLAAGCVKTARGDPRWVVGRKLSGSNLVQKRRRRSRPVCPLTRARAYRSIALRAERGHPGQACLAFLNPPPAETKFDPHLPALTR